MTLRPVVDGGNAYDTQLVAPDDVPPLWDRHVKEGITSGEILTSTTSFVCMSAGAEYILVSLGSCLHLVGRTGSPLRGWIFAR